MNPYTATDIETMRTCSAYWTKNNVRWLATVESMVKALEAVEALLDGRQPIDAPGALMVARNALGRSG